MSCLLPALEDGGPVPSKVNSFWAKENSFEKGERFSIACLKPFSFRTPFGKDLGSHPNSVILAHCP